MEKQYISVYALNKYIKAKLNQDISLQSLYIKGEISNYRPHPSGHIYFTLKDDQSRINAVMFASKAVNLDFELKNGMEVLIKASVSVYETTGQYQLYVDSMIQEGLGSLYLKFNELKNKLKDEGLFDERHKKSIPSYPKSIAILSAKQGAALQDILKTIKLRFPIVRTIVFPIPVQGKDAYKYICEVLRQVDRLGFDTIIVARGGGSLEDLWNFNEEELARCIFGCKTPIISGVGHETDFTICDFVSDYRVATPTAAAIKATPDQKSMREYNESLNKRLVSIINNKLKLSENKFNHLRNSYVLKNPEYIYGNELMRLVNVQDRLNHHFQTFTNNENIRINNLTDRMHYLINKSIDKNGFVLSSYINKLDALSPLKVLSRGYSIVSKDDEVVVSANDLQSLDEIEIQFSDGKKQAIIK